MSEIFNQINARDVSDIGGITFYLSYTVLLVAIILTIYYTVIFINDRNKQSLYSANKLNIQSSKYNSIRIFDILNNDGSFNMFYVSSLHGVSFILAVVAFIYLDKLQPNVYIGMIVSVLIIVLHILMMNVNKHYTETKYRINQLNRSICNNIYKKVDFLKIIRNSLTISTFHIRDTITNCLKTIGKDVSEKDLIKAFFTLTMFNHFAKIHHSNRKIDHKQLFGLFDYTTLLCKNCNPVRFLHVSGTQIEHITDTLIEPNIHFRTASAIKAMKECAIIVDSINIEANNLNMDDSYKKVFVPMVVVTLFIQIMAIGTIHKDDISRFITNIVDSYTKREPTISSTNASGILAILLITIQLVLATIVAI